jgi:mono/diheme cytochrome c family protein
MKMRLNGFVFSCLFVSAAAAQDGKALFEKKCAFCHATTTDERKLGPSLKGLKGGVMPDAIGKAATKENILLKVNDGGGGMPAFRDLLTKEEKEAIVAYAMTL